MTLLSELPEIAQRLASDPDASVWVSASAGTGKTHLLTMRVLRLMLAGVPLERILCLTYTTAAATEMSKRVFAALADWVSAPPASLRAKLTKLLGRSPTPDEDASARTLFARAIDAPGGMKIQTIHAFCQALLRRFPLEAGVPPGFAVLDEGQARDLLREAIDDALSQATRDGHTLGPALGAVIRYAIDDTFDDRLREAISDVTYLDLLDRLELIDGGTTASALQKLYRSVFALPANLSLEQVERSLATILSNDDLAAFKSALSQGSKRDRDLAEAVAAAIAETTPAGRIDALAGVFCTQSGSVRGALMTNPLQAAHSEVHNRIMHAQQEFCARLDQKRSLDVVEATVALMQMALAVIGRYARAKARRAALDFNDLIIKTAALLRSAPGHSPGDAAEWVLFKLDGGLDHVLVDESQDTSPDQWAIVESLAAEFFSTEATSACRSRSLFAVGDEKQSIYSFQGAAPAMFAAKGSYFAAAALRGGYEWRPVALSMSFRSTSAVLDAVDRVFADPARTPGLTQATQLIRHACHRVGEGGCVEIWPTERPEQRAEIDPWSPLSEPETSEPIDLLAARIATTIREWLDQGESLVSQGRAIHAGDILILVRKRRPFANAMIRALEAARIPVAGTDRMALTGEIAVQDLIALGDFVTLPEDDLALAAVLKSPLFGLDDADLFDLAHDRASSLWAALLAKAQISERYAEAAAQLKRWRSEAGFAPPYEFFANVLDRDGVRAKLIQRLGTEAGDGLEEFLLAAIAFDDRAPPSLIAFLTALKADDREIKRDMEHGRAAVRVMTVHGAKGLEAPIVFLPDTCTTAGAASRAGLVDIPADDLPGGLSHVRVWAVKGSSTLPPNDAARRLQAAADTAERNRLLYVAMTRARDRLYICGFDSTRKRAPDCWYELIFQALMPVMDEIDAGNGRMIWRLTSEQVTPPSIPAGPRNPQYTHDAAEAQDWIDRPPPRETPAPIALAPSRIAAFSPAASHPPPDVVAPALASGAMERGTILHALLQHLPAMPPVRRRSMAETFVARQTVLNAAARDEIVATVLRILDDPALACFFKPNSRAEVPVAALVRHPEDTTKCYRVSGSIDRLCVTDKGILIIDYKSGSPAANEAAVPESYIYQLAAYRMVLAQIYRGSVIGCAILWTDEPRIMKLSSAMIDSATAQIWDAAPSRLDHKRMDS